jgi:FkbM family methyltransferase
MLHGNQVSDPEQVSELDGFIANCSPGMTLFDIGAHFGFFSLAALHYGGPNNRVVAVDPSPTVVGIMAIQARENGVIDRLKIVQAAVGNISGELAMVTTGVVGGNYFVLPRDHPQRDLTFVKEVTIDELSRIVNLVPSHIKIDVEGAEARVLEGANAVLTSASPVLFLELHHRIIREQGGNPEAALDFLDTFDYELFTTTGQSVTRQSLLAHDLVRCFAKRA